MLKEPESSCSLRSGTSSCTDHSRTCASWLVVIPTLSWTLVWSALMKKPRARPPVRPKVRRLAIHTQGSKGCELKSRMVTAWQRLLQRSQAPASRPCLGRCSSMQGVTRQSLMHFGCCLFCRSGGRPIKPAAGSGLLCAPGSRSRGVLRVCQWPSRRHMVARRGMLPLPSQPKWSSCGELAFAMITGPLPASAEDDLVQWTLTFIDIFKTQAFAQCTLCFAG